MIPACSGCKHEVVLAGKNFTVTFDNETSAEDVWLETLSMYRRIFLLCSQSEKTLEFIQALELLRHETLRALGLADLPMMRGFSFSPTEL